jgi:hypothetical protein
MRRARVSALLCILVLVAACASSPARIAYTSINGAVDAVQTALVAWNDVAYAPGVKVDPVTWNARRDQIGAAYAKFQASAKLATTLAQDITQKDNAVKIVSDAAAQIISLIQTLSGK